MGAERRLSEMVHRSFNNGNQTRPWDSGGCSSCIRCNTAMSMADMKAPGECVALQPESSNSAIEPNASCWFIMVVVCLICCFWVQVTGS